ncbi:hypothetical protein MIND_00056300 [Mycena indigotica]|uniref:Uncharacterized protein n=1 Tax=Mycena indigotica TaxID=2126181 RepID=A0A8H6TEU5_9AGAR|nr:uncharacterized protein MIND_00056300 [Mycena indigotica]KAF7315416.1 hypothetical protein MIND_00056300 [Mycena indigotica]
MTPRLTPLYVIRTSGTHTTVLRSDPWDGLSRTAEIKWPRKIPTKGKTREILGILIQLSDGRWQSADAILKPGNMLSSPPRFNIPNYSHSMRWKRVGSTYWCTTSSVKGPIAIFYPAVEGVPPRIKVFETLHDKYQSQSVASHNGVSIVLLDQLIITAMLLVTDVQDWMLVQKYEGADEGAPSIAPTSSSSDQMDPPQSAPASASQWRKILYGEPIFPKRSPSNMRSVSTTDLSKPLPTSSKQMAKIVYGDPLFPTLTASPAASSVWDSDDEINDYDDRVSVRTSGGALPSPLSSHFPARIHSPSTDSMCYPDGRSPSHPYMEASGYYGEDSLSVPPVPQIPAHLQYASSNSRGTTPPDSARSMSRSNSRSFKELPPPPISPTSPLTPLRANRSQSTPPREIRASSFERRPSEPLFLSPMHRSSSSRSSNLTSISSAMTSSSAPPPLPPLPPTPTLARSQSMKLRQLPQPPTPTESSSSNSPFSTRASRRVSTYSMRSQSSVSSARALPIPPGHHNNPPPLPPLPIPRKDEMWLYPWGEDQSSRTAPPFAAGEAPPPYVERHSQANLASMYMAEPTAATSSS